ncbi:MAG: hypothetical protein ABSG19_06510 [Candidatus Aminicenantales bacterium]
MDDPDLKEIRDAIGKLTLRNRRLTWALTASVSVLALGIIALSVFRFPSKSAVPADGVLTLRGLVILDANGVERVRIQAPLPDPLILGKRFPRGGAVSGILLSDEEGNERSGYVTSDGYPNVFFTLDSLARQHVLFITEPQGDPTLRLWDGASAATLSAGSDGPGLKLTAGEKTLLEIPARRPAGK